MEIKKVEGETYSITEDFFMNNKVNEKTIEKSTLKLIRVIINNILGKSDGRIQVSILGNNCLVGGNKVFGKSEDYKKLDMKDIQTKIGKFNVDNLIFYNNFHDLMIIDMETIINHMKNLGIIMYKVYTPYIDRKSNKSIFKEEYDKKIISYNIDITQAKEILENMSKKEIRKNL